MTRTLISSMHLTLDGFVNGPQGELEWANVEPEIAAEVDARLKVVGAAVSGREVCGMMAGHRPTVGVDPDGTEHERTPAAWVEAIPKVVSSRTPERAEWHHTTLIRDDVAAQVQALKARPGGGTLVFAQGHAPTLDPGAFRAGVVRLRAGVRPARAAPSTGGPA